VCVWGGEGLWCGVVLLAVASLKAPGRLATQGARKRRRVLPL
jgi:hypothetical protein